MYCGVGSVKDNSSNFASSTNIMRFSFSDHRNKDTWILSIKKTTTLSVHTIRKDWTSRPEPKKDTYFDESSLFRSHFGSRPAFLVQAIHCSSASLRGLSEFWFFSVALLQSNSRVQVVPRRGWQQLDVPSRWVRVLRGLRPNSEQRPSAHEKKEASLHSRSHRGSELGGRSVGPQRGKRPFEASAEGFGSCRARSQIASVDKRIESCKSFFERARKGTGRLEEVARATTEKEACLQESAESERLEQLEARVLPTQVDAQVEASVGVSCKRRSTFCRRSGMFCWHQPPQFCRGQPQSHDTVLANPDSPDNRYQRHVGLSIKMK